MSAKTVLLWPLWSPKRLGLTAVALVAVLGILGGCAGAGHSKPTAGSPTATPGGSNGQVSVSRSPSPTPSPTTAPVDHSADVAVAVKFVTVWASHTPAAVWVPALQALSTPTLAAGWVGTDPAIVKATKVTGPGVWTSIEGHGAVQVPTDAGLVLVIVTPGGKVDDLTPMVPTAPAPNVAVGR